MTKMAAMTIYGENHFNIFFLGTRGTLLKKLGMYHQGLRLIIIC